MATRCRPVEEYGAAGAEGDLQRVTAETEALNRRIEEAHRVGVGVGWGLKWGPVRGACWWAWGARCGC